MKKALSAAIGAAFLSICVPSYAGLAVSGAIPAGDVTLSDNSAEQWFDNDGDRELSVGDVLRGIFVIDNTAFPTVSLGVGTAYNELTGIFQVLVSAAANPVTIGQVPRKDFTFVSDPNFAAEFGVANGTVGIMFEDPSTDFKREQCGGAGIAGTFAQCEATASNGSVWASFNIASSWTAASSALDPTAGGRLPNPTSLGAFGLGLNFVINNTGYTWNKVACSDPTNLLAPPSFVDMCGQGGIIATGRVSQNRLTPYDIWDNVDFTLNRVPEPSILALIGIGMFGLGAINRRKESKPLHAS